MEQFIAFLFLALPIANFALIVNGLLVRKVKFWHAGLIVFSIVFIPWCIDRFGPESTGFGRGIQMDVNFEAILASFFVLNLISFIFLCIKTFNRHQSIEVIDG